MKLVYLHSVGPDGDANRSWLSALNDTLTTLGFDPVDDDQVVAPRYAAILGMKQLSVKHPKRTYSAKNDRAARRDFERHQARVEREIRSFQDVRTFGFHRVGAAVVNPVQAAAIKAAPIAELRQVQNYLQQEDIRAAVLQHILDNLPTSGEIILIGHSLGSIIAIDLLDNLPSEITVRRFITVGSPAGSPTLHAKHDRILKRFPYKRVHDWSNFLDPADVITAGKGLAALFPGAQDFMITGAATHSAAKYLRHQAIATLVGKSLQPSTEVIPASGKVAARLSDSEACSLATLEFAHHVAANIDDAEKRDRFEDAVQVLRDNYVAEFTTRNPGRARPTEIAALERGHMPSVPRRWELPEAIALTVVLANTNLISPHEIDTDDAALEAIGPFMTQLGFPTGTSAKVRKAIEDVNAALTGSSWSPSAKTRIAMAAVGVAILAAGPIGLAAAGAAGTAGAAAITSGLAAFGPGGMAGGIAMLTGLSGTGGMVAAAAATARGGASTPVVDPSSLAIRVAIAQALKNSGEPYDTRLWQDIACAETELAADRNRLAAFSDPKAPVLKKLDNAQAVLEALQNYLQKHDLIPSVLAASLQDGAKIPTPQAKPKFWQRSKDD